MRYTLAVLLNVVIEWAIFLGVLVYAFDRGGAAQTGFASIALLLPYVACAPLAGALAERHPPQRVRIGGMALQTAGCAVAALGAAADLHTAAVVAATMVALAGTTTLGPAGAVLRPAIVRSSQELTVANLWTGYADSVSVFVGPLLAATMLAVGGAPAVIAACAASSALALLVSLVRWPADPPGGSELTDRIGAFSLMRRELRALAERPGILGVLAAAGGQYFVIGALDIIVVVAAEEELGLGSSGPGALAAAMGAGALLSAWVTTVLARRPRLAPFIGVAMLSLVVGTLVLGIALTAVVAFVVLPVLGLARSVQDLLGQMLLQRSAEPEALGAVFAGLELAAGLALILGSVATQALIAVAGVRAALIGTGAFFAVLALATSRSLRSADDSADVPVVAMSLLRRTPVLGPLPRAALEAAARSAVEVTVAAGDVVITQGEPGDRYYAVADGEFVVSIDGRPVERCGRGDAFGELALLTDAPRAAEVTAASAGALLALDRGPFLVAVTGHDSSRQAAWGVMKRHHGDDAPVAGPDDFVEAPGEPE